MGCDIHSYAERMNVDGKWESMNDRPFDWRSYNMYAFLAGVRNYSNIPPISSPRDLPSDVSNYVQSEWGLWGIDGHTPSWLDVMELSEFNYDTPIIDCRVTKQLATNYWSGGETCEGAEGQQTTYREYLGEHYFEELKRIQDLNVERIVFWFDN